MVENKELQELQNHLDKFDAADYEVMRVRSIGARLVKDYAALQDKLTEAEEEKRVLRDKYNELLYQVQNKILGKTRHEAAIMAIRKAENTTYGPCEASSTKHDEEVKDD